MMVRKRMLDDVDSNERSEERNLFVNLGTFRFRGYSKYPNSQQISVLYYQTRFRKDASIE